MKIETADCVKAIVEAKIKDIKKNIQDFITLNFQIKKATQKDIYDELEKYNL